MTENERAMYSGLALCRNTELTLHWSRNQFFFLVNSTALSFVTTLGQPEFRDLFIGGFVGVILSSSWFFANWRTDQWIAYWQSRLEVFELSEPMPAEIPLFSGLAYQRVAGRRITFHRIVAVLAGIFTVAWADVLVRAFFL